MKYITIFLLLVSKLYAQPDNSPAVVQTSKHGYQYKHLVSNTGVKPALDQYAYCNVYVYQNDSLVFSNEMSGMESAMIPVMNPDSSTVDDQPVMEALALMSIGDSLIIYHNLDSLKKYVPAGYPVPKLAYCIQLKAIKSKDEYAADMVVLQEKQNKLKEASTYRLELVEDSLKNIITAYKKGELDKSILVTKSGLKYIVLHEGNGNIPKPGANVNANYMGMLTDAKVFDSSYSRGEPLSFPIGQNQVIEGWEEAFMLFKRGTTAVIFIPSRLGYGSQGAPPMIPGNAELVFYIESL